MAHKTFTQVWAKEASHNGPITLGKELGAGGEGSVYDVRNDSGIVVKIYHPERRTSNVFRKLDLMIQYPPRTEDEHNGHLYVAWPKHLVYDSSDNAIGFAMPKVNKKNSLFEYYIPSRRKKSAQHVNYASLCKVAQSLAKSLDELHGRGYVVGDINESNAYIVEDDHVTLIDSDSFQVRDYQTTPNAVYRCIVGKPEYTPPELQSMSFKNIDRAPFHDRFALAVAIYQLLMEGSHPFRGIYKGTGEPPKVEAYISRGYFLHSKSRSVPLAPTSTAVPWDSLHSNIKNLFIRCFDKGHTDPQSRPEPKEWASALEQAMKDLSQCKVNPNHWYFRNKLNGASGMGCTWCARPIEAFPAQHKTNLFVPTIAPKKTIAQTTPSQKTKPKGKAKPQSVTSQIQPPGYKFHAPDKWSTWVRDNIDSIREKPVPDGTGNTVVHYLKGTHYRYKLEFPVVRKWLIRSLGTPKVYRRPRTWYWKSKPKWYWEPKPQWEVIGRRDFAKQDLKKVPKWILKEISKIPGGSSLGGKTYTFKGKRYRYMVEFLGHGGSTMTVARKPRTWYWKKIKS